jgi:hypothetical protein
MFPICPVRHNGMAVYFFHDQINKTIQIKHVTSLLNINLNIKFETDKRQLASDN